VQYVAFNSSMNLFRPFRIFELAPGAISMFGFGKGVDQKILPETLFKLSAFQIHTSGVVAMLESALVMMIGNDMDSLAKALSDLGSNHIVYGVQPAHYLIVESALIRTLQLGLKDQWTVSIKKDWAAVFKFIARAMMLGAENCVEIVKATRRNAEQQKVATLRLKAISPSNRTKTLTCGSRSGNSRNSRFEGEQRSKLSRRNSDPPKLPVRGAASRLRVFLGDIYDEGRDESDSDDSMSSENRTTGNTMTGESHDWYWGNSSTEPPKMPQRALLNESFDSVSSFGSVDQIPLAPRRALSPRPSIRSLDWYLGKSSIEPSKMPQRPPLIISNKSFSSVSSFGSVDQIPLPLFDYHWGNPSIKNESFGSVRSNGSVDQIPLPPRRSLSRPSSSRAT
jgi:hypothetical protein